MTSALYGTEERGGTPFQAQEPHPLSPPAPSTCSTAEKPSLRAGGSWQRTCPAHDESGPTRSNTGQSRQQMNDALQKDSDLTGCKPCSLPRTGCSLTLTCVFRPPSCFTSPDTADGSGHGDAVSAIPGSSRPGSREETDKEK
ncbi:unnamed protein product [Rangifer tarandus platyrhynchus]|uniref:Uncharacterized protein n=1 Tax=Rangifer tarandus platyrhynchus TaxID=3082113 RepID=A0ABN8Y216_RANTA|nr:unnamed protein product [Rangifer tarandus platyrhynchus]